MAVSAPDLLLFGRQEDVTDIVRSTPFSPRAVVWGRKSLNAVGLESINRDQAHCVGHFHLPLASVQPLRLSGSHQRHLLAQVGRWNVVLQHCRHQLELLLSDPIWLTPD